MSATVIVLAEWRERKASVTYSFDPLSVWFAWVGYWWGVR